jgi:hypothetical protein
MFSCELWSRHDSSDLDIASRVGNNIAPILYTDMLVLPYSYSTPSSSQNANGSDIEPPNTAFASSSAIVILVPSWNQSSYSPAGPPAPPVIRELDFPCCQGQTRGRDWDDLQLYRRSWWGLRRGRRSQSGSDRAQGEGSALAGAGQSMGGMSRPRLALMTGY